MGTSRGTFDTLALADYLSDKIAGEIHTSSMDRIAWFDPRPYKNRHLIVHHVNDSCRVTPYGAALNAHRRYGTEREAADAIKRWVKQGDWGAHTGGSDCQRVHVNRPADQALAPRLLAGRVQHRLPAAQKLLQRVA